MSGRKDRERAESGLIFRDGHLVRKEDWYKIHPTREMLAQQQTVVDAAVKDAVQKIVHPDKLIEVPEEQPYFCSKCQRTHRVGTKIYEQHIEHCLPGIEAINSKLL